MNQQVDKLKSSGEFREAGRLSASLGLHRSYGCHFGMRSSRLRAIEEFYEGYDSYRPE